MIDKVHKDLIYLTKKLKAHMDCSGYEASLHIHAHSKYPTASIWTDVSAPHEATTYELHQSTNSVTLLVGEHDPRAASLLKSFLRRL